MALPPFLDNFVNGPKLPKIVLGVMGLVMLGVGAHFLALGPLRKEVAALDAQNASLQREVAQNRAIVAELERFRKELAELESRLALLMEKLPTEKETPPLYRSVHDAAVESGLAVSLFQPRDPRARDYYQEIPITVTAEGGYHDLGQFLERVSKLPRVVNLTELKASGLTRAKNSLRAELTLATYMYRSAGGAPSAKSPTPAPKPAGAQ
jgi:type IV pilus assembly protein PilO